MNAHVDVERMERTLALREWAARCREMPARGLPRLILDVCQALYDTVLSDRPPVERKRAVFGHVAAGDCRAAILAMVPPGFSVSLDRDEARILAPGSGLEASAQGPDADHALLACIVDLALSLDKAQCERIYA